MAHHGIVVGGGASGLTAAIAAAEGGAEVTVLERMPRVGKKLLSTGNGKCNMTNLRMDGSCYRCGEENFPMDVIRRFPVEATMAFFRRLGVRAIEKNGYVYPASEQASSVLDALRGKLAELSVPLVCDCRIGRIRRRGERFLVDTDGGPLEADFVILAAGSMAAPATGSDGSGYDLARAFGHHIKKPLPALVQLRCGESFFKSLAGVRAEASVCLYGDGKRLAFDRGELQLTDYGISGIPVFQVSRFAAEALDEKREVMAALDFFPGGSREELLALLKEQRTFLKRREAAVFLDGLFNKKLAAQFLKGEGIRPELPVSSLTDGQLSRLARRVKEFTVLVTSTNAFPQAQTCMGGVDAAEIDSGTMESKRIRKLYFAGEIVDVDGICGGYNLQWAWSSGFLAGASAAKADTGKRGYI